MKKLLMILFSFQAITLYAQKDSGLIAHWDMNGEVKDISGNGHDGTAHNLISDTGLYGKPNTAYYFDGISSGITANSGSDFKLTRYSICAIIKVKDFNVNNCQANAILMKGVDGTSGCLSLHFTDNVYDSSCYMIDSNENFFCSSDGTNTPYYRGWQMGAPIATNKWYKIVMTYDSAKWQLFTNGILQGTAFKHSGMSGSSTDSLSIGYSIYDSLMSANPFKFKGLIDDIRIYNRVLTDSEAIHYGDTCGKIVKEPATISVQTDSNAIYTVGSSIVGANYQWQQDAGIGFMNLTNAGPYSGVNTNTLTVASVTKTLNNTHYRCVIANTWGCADTTTSVSLGVVPTDVQNVLLNDEVLLYPNPADKRITLMVPYSHSNGRVQLINEVGQVCMQKVIDSKATFLDVSNIASGIYIARIELDGQTVYKKLLKN